MKVIHIAPSAFNYFDDIRDRVFSWVEELNERGIDATVLTLQYETPTREVKRQVAAAAPSVEYDHADSVAVVTESIVRTIKPPEREIIHLHTPFLGGGRDIINFVKSRPDAHFLVTHHRPVRIVDFFSIYIHFYNQFYLPKLFFRAEAILLIEPKKSTNNETERLAGSTHIFRVNIDKKDNVNYPHPMPVEGVADNLILMYNYLMGK
ncbi:MAG: hypothetical protein A2538_03770 [Candidatus Magasanikbacteria bacterium RIFOXYD2_FULL_41_14]|uniref:Glycosyltransferase subfamily 4-like N-terminal domain-containing protein n=1 Tax=Candidatus Magasanikbacteria bacterium RIFOXYD2_FULL_41_14 TaxID=1798709 RepID=A0A1F6PDD3_9BACT|nr:MAG: hypothetical protein A2538_03770 [Candidatus Magasanikbacteria bacterium RIFOXYD2_FULL_41_14]